jgi:hypothetical protein
MEYRRSYRDETPDWHLVDRHEHEIFPLVKKRHIFSGSADFCLYDFCDSEGSVNENVFAYSNRAGDERALIVYNNSYSQASGWTYRGSAAIPQKDGTKKQHLLSEALSLHGENRFFTVFREHRSGLWYIRSSKEIAERGLFAALNGYEAQIFMDIQEREDEVDASPASWESRWATLSHALNGRGVRNLEAAVMDISLGELYTPFREILSSHRMGDESIESFREPVNNFVAVAEKYLNGGGKYIPWKGIQCSTKAPKKGEEVPALKNPASTAWQETIP